MFFKKKSKINDQIDYDNLPKHIAIILDGNGRWAKRRGLPRSAGHTAGARTLEGIIRHTGNIGVKYLTVYAFSTENWNRPKKEVDALMKLLGEYLDDYKRLIGNENIRVKVIGSKDGLSDDILKKINTVEKSSEKNRDGLTLNIALNYGSKQEIVYAVKCICEKVKAGDIDICDINESTMDAHLYTMGCPSPDLIIRPSGEKRLSNFLMWQGAYSEFWFSDILWPDFKNTDLDNAIIDYQKRDRRFGGV